VIMEKKGGEEGKRGGKGLIHEKVGKEKKGEGGGNKTLVSPLLLPTRPALAAPVLSRRTFGPSLPWGGKGEKGKVGGGVGGAIIRMKPISFALRYRRSWRYRMGGRKKKKKRP